jgi:hypothetical protein
MLPIGPPVDQHDRMPPDPPPVALGDDPRMRARAELLWYLRHADALARWPVLAEPWAQRIERRRLEPDGGGGGAAPPARP